MHETKTYSVCTTFSPRGYLEYGRRMIETFDQFWPTDIILYVYYEGTLPDYISARVKYRSITESCPDLFRFLERNKDNPRDESDKVKYINDEGMPIYDINHAGRRFAFKSYVECHANMNTETDYILWLDADTVTLQPLPISIIEKLCPDWSLVSYFGRQNYTETGWIGFNCRHPQHSIFISEIKSGYDNDLIYTYTHYHDCVNFDEARKRVESIYNAKSFNITEAFKIRTYHPIPLSPLGKYIDHLKGIERKVKGKSFPSDYRKVDIFSWLRKRFKKILYLFYKHNKPGGK